MTGLSGNSEWSSTRKPQVSIKSQTWVVAKKLQKLPYLRGCMIFDLVNFLWGNIGISGKSLGSSTRKPQVSYQVPNLCYGQGSHKGHLLSSPKLVLCPGKSQGSSLIKSQTCVMAREVTRVIQEYQGSHKGHPCKNPISRPITCPTFGSLSYFLGFVLLFLLFCRNCNAFLGFVLLFLNVFFLLKNQSNLQGLLMSVTKITFDCFMCSWKVHFFTEDHSRDVFLDDLDCIFNWNF